MQREGNPSIAAAYWRRAAGEEDGGEWEGARSEGEVGEVEGPRDGLAPGLELAAPLLLAHLGAEGGRRRRLLRRREYFHLRPHADGQPRRVRRPEAGRLDVRRPHYRAPQQVRLHIPQLR